jgi:hypothetical protein
MHPCNGGYQTMFAELCVCTPTHLRLVEQALERLEQARLHRLWHGSLERLERGADVERAKARNALH